VAALVQQSAIREHLLTALDDWAEEARRRDRRPGEVGAEFGIRVSGRDKELSQKLQAITRQLDLDPWRNRLRDAMVSREVGALEQLARSAPVQELPATTLDRLGRRFNQMQLKPMPEPMLDLLRRAQQRFPDDLWINYNLATALSRSPQVEARQEAIGFFRVVVALRPQDTELLSEVAAVFSDVGKLAEAEAAHRKIVKLRPEQVESHERLGDVLLKEGKLAEAEAAYRNALEVDNALEVHPSKGPWEKLRDTLRKQGKPTEAVLAQVVAARRKRGTPTSVAPCSSKGIWRRRRRPTARPSSSTPMRTMRTTSSASRCTARAATRKRRPSTARP
jgi:tetratricopeptide (TPR) repeat protein